MKKDFTIKSKVWRWPGVQGWHFVSIDKKLTAKIKEGSRPYTYGSGFVRIDATIGKTTWRTALFPYTKENIYMISIKQSVRKKEDILEGDEVKINFSLKKS